MLTASGIYKIGARNRAGNPYFRPELANLSGLHFLRGEQEAALGILSSLYAGTGTILLPPWARRDEAANLGREILAANISPGAPGLHLHSHLQYPLCGGGGLYNEPIQPKWTVRIAITTSMWLCSCPLWSIMWPHCSLCEQA